MKKKLKFYFKCLFSLLTISLFLNLISYACAEEKNESDNFNFIKSETETNNFIYDGSLLLYGGIVLILVSISGMTFTLASGKKKTASRKEKQSKNHK